MALDDPQPNEIDVTQITVPDNHKSVFMAKVPKGYVSAAAAARLEAAWKNLWKRAGVEKAPPIVIVDDSFEISALSDAELLSNGLMRVPSE